MAKLNFILQAVTTANHAEAIRTLLSLPLPTQVMVSVAFVRELGLNAVEAVIKPHAEKTTFFVGIRNDITSIQAVKRLLAMNVALYAVDTADIPHPILSKNNLNSMQPVIHIGDRPRTQNPLTAVTI